MPDVYSSHQANPTRCGAPPRESRFSSLYHNKLVVQSGHKRQTKAKPAIYSHRRKKPQKGEEPPSTALHSTHHIMHTFNAHAHTKTLFFGRVTPAILHLTCGALPPSTRPQGSSNCAAFVGMPRPALGKKPVLSRIFPMRRHSHIADTYSHPWVEKWWKWVLCVVASPC